MSRILTFISLLAALLATGCAEYDKILSRPDERELPGYNGNSSRQRVLSVLWRLQLVDPDTFSSEYHHHGTPAVSADGSRIFVGAFDGSIYCLMAEDGSILWRKMTRGPVESQPSLCGGVVYVGSSDGNLYALRMSDGKELFSHNLPGAVSGRPVVTGDKVLVMTDVNSLVCLNAQTGKWLWNYRRNIPAGRFQVKGVADPLVRNGIVYAGFSDGFLVTLSLEDGSVQNTKHLSGKEDHFDDIDSSPVFVDGSLITGTFGQGIFSLDPLSLSEQWKYSTEGPSSIEVDDDMLYFTTASSKIVALKAGDGSPKWLFSAKKGQLSRPVSCGRWLLASSEEYSMIVLERESGKLVQIFNPGKGANGAPSVHANRVYWLSNGATLYAMALTQ